MNRKNVLFGLGALTLASCAGGGFEPQNSLVGTLSGHHRRPMSLPSGYTTTLSNSGSIYTTTIFYQGQTLASLSVDTSTYITTLKSFLTNQTWTTTSPKGSVAGGMWQAATGVVCTFSSTGDGATVVANNQSGYCNNAVDPTTSDYYTMVYHPSYWTAPTRVDSNVSSGGGGGNGGVCHTHVCPNNTFSCAEAIVGTGIAGVGLAASAAGLITGALTPLAIVGLVTGHIAFLWGIGQVARECL